MVELASFFIILLTALVFSQVFGRFHVPWIITLIVGGMIVGPHGLGVVTPDTTLEFFKDLGLVFLMFMAGLHIRFSGMKIVLKESLIIAGVAGTITFLTGITIGMLLGYDIGVSIILGIIFISSSIAVLIPFLEKRGLLHSRIGQTAISAIMIQDIASLVFLAIALQYLFATTTLPFPIYIIIFILTILVVGIVKWGIPHLKKVLALPSEKKKDIFERDLRLIFAVLLGMVIISEALGLHSIIGAFFAGIILSEVINRNSLKEKIHVLAYGLFIPIFFVVIGTQTDPLVFLRTDTGFLLLIFIVLASIISKIVGGWFASRLAGFTSSQGLFLGTCGIPQLSTTLAVVAVGQDLGIIGDELITAFILLSVVTTFTGPLLSGYIFRRVKKDDLAGDLKMYFSKDVSRRFARHEQNEKNFKVAEAVDRVVIEKSMKFSDPLYVAELGGGAHPDRYHELFSRLLKEPKGHIDWVDASSHMLKLAHEYISTPEYKKRKSVISFRHNEVTSYLYSLKDETIDVAIMKYVIDHIEDLNELFTLLSLKLKKGGFFVATINTDPHLKSHSTNARYFYKGESFPEDETRKLKDGDSYTIRFFKESGNPGSGYITGAETRKYFHSKEKIERLAHDYGFDIFLGDWKDCVSEKDHKDIIDLMQEILILTKK